MEQAERQGASSGASAAAGEGVTRSQHVVYTLPHTAEALTGLLAPALERIDITQEGVQLVIVTADAENAVVVSDLVYQLAGPQGIEVVPVTSANRAARLMIDRPIHAVAGSPLELQTLMQRSVLKLASVRTVVLGWADDIIASGEESVNALEVLFSELPKETSRLLVTRSITPEVEQLIERYARTARRVKEVEAAEEEGDAIAVKYLVVSSTSRASALRRLLDDIDPPSAAVVVRSDSSRAEATQALAQLGYRRADDAVRVVDGAVDKGTHTVVLYDCPVTRAELSNVAEGAVNTLALVTPQQVVPLRQLTASLTPFTLSGPGDSVRNRDRVLRDELSAILENRVAARELLALEPLLQQYDGIEVAAAAIRLLERERAKVRATPAAAPAPRPSRDRDDRGSSARGGSDRWTDRDARGGDRGGERGHDRGNDRGGDSRPKREFSDRPARDFGGDSRPKRDFGDRPPKRDFNDRPKREFSDRPKREFSDRPKRDFGDRPPKRDFGDRPKPSFGGKPSFGKRDFGAKRDFGDKPKRDFGGPRKGNFGRGPR